MKDDFKTRLALHLIKYIDYRRYENKVAMRFLYGCQRILDVGCGTGSFIQNDPERIQGIDVNPNNVDICKSKGLKVSVGDALDIQFDDNSFDGVFCSHVIQIFDHTIATQLLKELRRITKPGGVIVIATFPDHHRLFFTPATFRAYPPHAIRVLVRQPTDIMSPSSASNFSDAPLLKQEDIWLRRPALFEFEGPRNEVMDGLATVVNLIQHKLFLRKYWAYNGYVMKLRNGPKENVEMGRK